MRAVFLEKVAVDAVAAGEVHQVELESYEAAGGHSGDDGGTVRVGLHVVDAGLTFGKALHHAAHGVGGNIDIEGFKRLTEHTVDALDDDHGPGDDHFKTFATHLFHKNGNLHGATRADVKDA